MNRIVLAFKELPAFLVEREFHIRWEHFVLIRLDLRLTEYIAVGYLEHRVRVPVDDLLHGSIFKHLLHPCGDISEFFLGQVMISDQTICPLLKLLKSYLSYRNIYGISTFVVILPYWQVPFYSRLSPGSLLLVLQKLRKDAGKCWLFYLFNVLKMPQEYFIKQFFFCIGLDSIPAFASALIFELDIIALVFAIKLFDLSSVIVKDLVLACFSHIFFHAVQINTTIPIAKL